MGMNTYVEGVIPPDDKYKQYLKIYRDCERLGVSIPKEVDDFFGHQEPEDGGMAIDLHAHPCCSEYNAEMREGLIIDLRLVPPHVKLIRFCNSW